MPRFYCNEPLAPGAEINLPAQAARHAQVLRMQPGQGITLFPGAQADGNHEYAATIVEMGRQHVRVRLESVAQVDREARPRIHLLAGMPANERMDWLVEKAVELGAASITPIAAERSMLRLKGERAQKKQAHWQAIAIAACEQCGRNAVPQIAAATGLPEWLKTLPATVPAGDAAAAHFLVLTPRNAVASLAQWASRHAEENVAKGAAADRDAALSIYVLTGPEGGLTDAELVLAHEAGFVPVSLGQRVLRSETAPLAALAVLTMASA